MTTRNDNKQGSGTRGGTSEQHAAAGRQSHKNDENKGSSGSASGGGARTGSGEQRSAPGRQSNKSDH